MTQYLGVISQFRLSFAMSHVYACISVPPCTLLSNCYNYQFSPNIHDHTNTTSQHLYHTLKYHKVVTSRYGEKKSRCSGTTSSLQRRTLTSRVFQPEPTRCSENNTRCSECTLSQSTKSQISRQNLLFSNRVYLL